MFRRLTQVYFALDRRRGGKDYCLPLQDGTGFGEPAERNIEIKFANTVGYSLKEEL
jgi:hypothetical protein